MHHALEALEAILVDEVALYRALAARLPFKTALIRRNRVEQLDRLTRQEEADLKRVAELEAARQVQVQALLLHLPDGTPARLVAITPLLPQSWQTRFNDLGATLKGHARALQEGHANCVAMLQAGLETIDLTMSLVGDAALNLQPAMYGRAEISEARTPSILLDRRA